MQVTTFAPSKYLGDQEPRIDIKTIPHNRTHRDIYWGRVENDCLQVWMATATDQVVMVGLGMEKVGMMHVPREIW